MTTTYKKIVDGIDTATFILTNNQVIQKRQGALVWFADTLDNDDNLLKKNAQHSSHYPGHYRLIIEGYYLVVAANHNPATHNIVADSWVINGEETRHNTVELTDEEMTTRTDEAAAQTIQKAWLTSDRELTVRMQEDIALIATGRETLFSLQEKNGGKKIPLELWLDDRETKPGRNF